MRMKIEKQQLESTASGIDDHDDYTHNNCDNYQDNDDDISDLDVDNKVDDAVNYLCDSESLYQQDLAIAEHDQGAIYQPE